MNRKQKQNITRWLKGIPEENIDFYRKQLESAYKETLVPASLPYSFFLQGFKIKSHNKLKGKWSSTTERNRAIKAFNDAGVANVSIKEGRREVTITRLLPPNGKPMDKINRSAGCKWLLDQLTERGWIPDDSENWIEDHYPEVKPNSAQSWGVKIEIKEIE